MPAARASPLDLPAWGPGHLVGGKYRLVREVARGGMGALWSADHVALGSPVAIKLLGGKVAGNSQGVARFMREAQVASSLKSPHVVQTFDHGVDNGVPYIVMELLEGESLADRLARLGTLSFADTVRVITHICRAIVKAHDAGIVHRDLKPSNVFIVRNDDEDLIKVLDFGIAKIVNPVGMATPSATPQTQTGALIGTPHYMSPEQAQGTKTVDWRSDLWAIAVIAYECIVGRKPFESEALGDLILKICMHPIPVPSAFGPVPDGFDAWFAKGVSRDVEQRFQAAADMSRTLRQLLQGAMSESGDSAVPYLSNAGTLEGLDVQSRKRPLGVWGPALGWRRGGAIAAFSAIFLLLAVLVARGRTVRPPVPLLVGPTSPSADGHPVAKPPVTPTSTGPEAVTTATVSASASAPSQVPARPVPSGSGVGRTPPRSSSPPIAVPPAAGASATPTAHEPFDPLLQRK